MINVVIPRVLLRPALMLSLTAWCSCLVVTASPFLGWKAPVAALPFVLLSVFPLYSGAILVLLRRRAEGIIDKSWMRVLFAGLPAWFLTTFQVFWFGIGLACVTAFTLTVLGRGPWVFLFFSLVPSGLHAASIGAYWSELRHRQRGEQDGAANGSQLYRFETNRTSSAADSRR